MNVVTPTPGAPRAWLFQANPRTFDIDGYLATRRAEFVGLVRQYGVDIKIGDRVFLWRSIGDGDRDASGVVAEARVISQVAPMPEVPVAQAFWRGAAEEVVVQSRNWEEAYRRCVGERRKRTSSGGTA